MKIAFFHYSSCLISYVIRLIRSDQATPEIDIIMYSLRVFLSSTAVIKTIVNSTNCHTGHSFIKQIKAALTF